MPPSATSWGTAPARRRSRGPDPPRATSNTTSAARPSPETDTDNNAADFVVGPPTPGDVITEPPGIEDLTIHDIQGAAHLSPYAGERVLDVPGVVTAVRNNGFWMQTPAADADADPASSEGLFVFTSAAPTVAVGAAVEVTGDVAEFRGRGHDQPDDHRAHRAHGHRDRHRSHARRHARRPGRPRPTRSRHRRRRDGIGRGQRHLRRGCRRHRLLGVDGGHAPAHRQRGRGRTDAPASARSLWCPPAPEFVRRAAASTSAPPTSTPSGSSSTTCWRPCRTPTPATASPARPPGSSTTPSGTSSCCQRARRPWPRAGWPGRPPPPRAAASSPWRRSTSRTSTPATLRTSSTLWPGRSSTTCSPRT